MDFQIERKKEIIEVIKRKKEANKLSQSFLLDMQQELNRCNHLMNHILRSQYNFEGRLACAAALSTLGFLITCDKINALSRFNIKNVGVIAAVSLVSGVVGYYIIGSRRFGNLPDYRKNLRMYNQSLSLDKEIEPIVKGFRV